MYIIDILRLVGNIVSVYVEEVCRAALDIMPGDQGASSVHSVSFGDSSMKLMFNMVC